MRNTEGRDRLAEITSAMARAGADVIYDADYNFGCDAEDVAARVYAAMRALLALKSETPSRSLLHRP